MSSRRPMPPGMMPGGMPAGMTPAMMQQMMRQMPPGAMGGMPGGPPGQPQQPPSKERFNPLPEGKAAVQVLKAHSGCQMPREAATLNALLSKAQEVRLSAEKETELDVAMAESITLVFRSDRECDKQMTTRTAGLFDEEEELKDLSDKIDSGLKELQEMETALKAKAEEYNAMQQQRWEKSIKLFGLNVQERFYRIEPVERKVVQVDLKCDSCQGIKMLRDARQKLTRILMSIEVEAKGGTLEPEEKTDGGAKEVETGHSADPGPSDRTPDPTPGEGGAPA